MYHEMIRNELAKQGFIGKYDPRHIEAYMRLENSTLDHLSGRQFAREVALCVACVDEGGTDAAERNARSFGI